MTSAVLSHRSNAVTFAQRAANAVFGSPSVRRANGGADASFTPRVLRGAAWQRRREGNGVFAVDRKGAETAERLPRIWVSEAIADPDGAGRAFVADRKSVV